MNYNSLNSKSLIKSNTIKCLKNNINNNNNSSKPFSIIRTPKRKIILMNILNLTILVTLLLSTILIITYASDNIMPNTDTSRHLQRKRSLNSEINFNNDQQHSNNNNQNLWHSSSKRHGRVSSSASSPTSLEQSNNNVIDGNQLGDCKSLLIFWNFLKNYYPSLTAHLYMLSLEQANGGTNQMITKLASDYSKRINKFLEQAEKLLNEQKSNLIDINSNSISNTPGIGDSNSNNNNRATSLETNNSNYRQPSGWLSRVASNPNYAKLISRLQHHYNSRLHSNSNDHEVIVLNRNNNQNNNINSETNTNPKTGALIEASGPQTNQQQQAKQSPLAVNSNNNNHDNFVYGKIIHYPHQMRESENGKAIDRLHQLSKFMREPPQPNGNTLNENNNNNNNEELESNKIPADGNSGNSGSSNDGSTTGPRDRNFVYGNILHSPSQKQEQPQNENNQQLNNYNHYQKHQSSMATLRQLMAQPEVRQQNSPYSSSSDESQSYGRILDSPVSISSPLQHRTSNNSYKRPSTLHKLKKILEPLNNQFYIGADDDDGGGAVSESSSHISTNQNDNPYGSSSLVDEFEGSFQSMPFEHPEVKQTRARDDPIEDDSTKHSNRQQMTTTPNSRNVFIVD